MSFENQGELDPLNAREREILDLLSRGLSNNEIALKLSLSLETVKWYNKHIFSKLGVASRTQAVAKAAETGILAGQSAPQIRKESRPAHNLPTPITSFIGREKEIQEVEHLVSSVRLVTITGSGGVGKTRLAIQVASGLTTQFIHGVRWASLAALSDTAEAQKRERLQTADALSPNNGHGMGEDLVTQAVAKSLRVAELPDLPLLQGVLEHLHEKKLLLVLDNCEHLIEPCAALVEQLLSNCPEVTILATSREALGVSGEKAWRLPSLSLPGEARLLDIQSLFQSEAVSLFIERAADVLPGYQPGEVDAPTIVQICRQLDGIPLAIELAAARMNFLSAQEIAARLDRRFSLLTGGRRTALPRHQTLRAAIEWSYDLLSEPEQRLFRRLSIFAGSFTLEAAEVICASQELPSDEVLTLLGKLVDKSLLNVEPAPQDSDLPTRYRFLDTIRSFGRLKLDEANETRWMQERRAGYYVRLIEAAEPELLLQNQAHWFKLLQTENDNIRAVIEWSAESDQAVGALRLVVALLWFWFSISSTREGLELALTALAVPSAVQFEKERARALNTASALHWFLGDMTAARQLLEEALAILKTSNDESSLAWSMQILGLVLTSEGKYDLADSAMKDGVSIAQKLGDYKSGIFSLAFQGDIALQKGDRSKAIRIYQESANLLQTVGNRNFLAYPLRRLGYLALEQHNIPQAWDNFRQSLILNHEVGDKRALTACLASMAALAIHLDKPVVAAHLYGAVESRLDSLSMNLLHLDQIELERIRTKLPTILDEEAYSTAVAKGWEMSEEQAVALAVEIDGKG